MPDDPNPTAPATPPSPKPEAPAQKTSDIGHVPMSEEFDRAKWTLPPIVPVLIGLAAVAIVVGLLVVTHRPKPTANGEITKVAAAEQADNVVVAVQIKFHNLTEQRVWVRNITSELEAADGKKYPDSSAAADDMNRYIQAFPVLGEAKAEPLREDLKIAPGNSFTGMTVFAYPVKKADFDARKSLTVTIAFYDRAPLVLKQ